MAERSTITVRVPRERVADDKSGFVREWLQPDGTFGPEETAITFRFWASPTPRDRDLMVKEEHGIYGVKEFVDLQRGIDGARQRLLTLITAELWPDGKRPEVKGKELIEQAELMDQAYARNQSPEKAHLLELTTRKDQIGFWARWTVLGIDLPEDWKKLQDRPGLDNDTLVAMMNGFVTALEEHNRGKSAPSRS